MITGCWFYATERLYFFFGAQFHPLAQTHLPQDFRESALQVPKRDQATRSPVGRV
jgi:hypothetical protein